MVRQCGALQSSDGSKMGSDKGKKLANEKKGTSTGDAELISLGRHAQTRTRRSAGTFRQDQTDEVPIGAEKDVEGNCDCW